MSILSAIFGNNQQPAAPAATNPAPAADPSQQQQAAVPTQQGNIPAAPTVTVDPNNPAAPVTPAPVENKVESPLDGFKNLWDTAPVDPNNPEPAKPQPLTAEQVQKAVAGANFSNAITPETLAAITAGGEDATAAFSTAMNEVAKQVMVQATMVNNKLTEKAVNEAVTTQQAKLPELLRQQAASNHLKETNPLFDNPAIKPVIEATQSQLLQKFPNATHAELTKMTQDYINAMGNAFAPQDTVNNNSSSAEPDWDAFLNS